MTKQNDQDRRRGFLQSAAGQLTLLVVGVILMLAFAWGYLPSAR